MAENVPFNMNNIAWKYKPLMKLTGGSNGKRVRRLWAGGFELVDTTGKEPRVVECNGGENVVVLATDARQAYELWKAGTEFPAVFPGVNADGSELVAQRCAILQAPTFTFVRGGSGLFRVASYSFSVTILDDY